MESFLVRYRNLLVLVALLLVQVLGLAVQVHRTETGRVTVNPEDSSGVRLIRLWANALVSPPERAIHGTGSGVGWIWTNYIDLRNTREKNKELQETVDRLRLEQAALLEDARQGERLQNMLGFQEKYIYKTSPAQVIGTSGTEMSRLVTIDKGKNAGLDHDMAVITADGIVGKIRDVFPRSAQILLINDQTSGAGVILESTRVRGVLRGNAFGQPQIVGIVADNRIQPGEKVLTAGGDQIFPRGLPVGEVEKVVPDPDQDGFIRVIVKPAAHLDRLDEVLVITSTEPRFPADQKQDMASSETQMGAAVAAVEKAQKKASEVMAERLPGLLDPNLPSDQQPLNDTSNPGYPPRPPAAVHPDRFTPDAGGSAAPAEPGIGQDQSAPESTPKKQTAPNKNQNSPAKKPAQPGTPAPQGRTP